MSANLKEIEMPKSGVILAIILAVLAVLLLSGIGIITFNPSISLQVLNAIGSIISAIFLALILAMDLLFVFLIARTPNRRWQP
jgi:hypothetical protein